MFIAPPQSMVVEKRSPLEEDKSRASNQNLRREQNLPAFTTQPNLHASYKIIYHICVLNNRHLFPFWMVRTWLASKPAAAVTIANRKQIWYLSKNWHNQTLKAIVLQSYNCNFVHSENFSQNEIVWMRVIKKCNIYVKFNSQSVSKKKSRDAMYEDYQTLIVDLSLYWFLLFFGKIYVAHGNKLKILFLEQISTLTERSRFRSLGGSFLQIT